MFTSAVGPPQADSPSPDSGLADTLGSDLVSLYFHQTILRIKLEIKYAHLKVRVAKFEIRICRQKVKVKVTYSQLVALSIVYS